jgi:putative Mn2+ efflux pump MntP
MDIGSKKVTLALPELGLIAMTRAMLGVGIGLLLSEALDKRTARGVGIALAAVGVLTTVPLLLHVREELA